MKILLDGISLTRPISGIGRYLTSTINSGPFQEETVEIHCALNAELDPSNGKIEARFHKLASSKPAWYLYKLGRLCQSINPDLFWGPAHKLPLYIPKDTQCVVTIHDCLWRKFPETMQPQTLLSERMFFQRAINRANAIICVSEATREDVAHFYPEHQHKLHTVMLGAYGTKIRRVDADKVTGLFVGTFEPRKNLARLIEAIAQLPESVKSNFKMKIVGRAGWGAESLENLVSTANLENVIEFTLNPSESELEKIYANCSFLTLISLHEGFGLPIVEALKHAKPVIVSDRSAMPEIAGNAGILVSPTKVSQITDALEKIITSHSLRAFLSKQALIESEKYDWEFTGQNTLSVFRSLLERRRAISNLSF